MNWQSPCSTLKRVGTNNADGSCVKLRGTIATPPWLRRHETESSLEIARTSLLVQVQQPSRRPGVAALRMKEDRVLIDVLVALPHAGGVMARDNGVCVKDWLHVYRARLNLECERLVADAITALEAQWRGEHGSRTRRSRMPNGCIRDACEACSMRIDYACRSDRSSW